MWKRVNIVQAQQLFMLANSRGLWFIQGPKVQYHVQHCADGVWMNATSTGLLGVGQQGRGGAWHCADGVKEHLDLSRQDQAKLVIASQQEVMNNQWEYFLTKLQLKKNEIQGILTFQLSKGTRQALVFSSLFKS